jgi:hypothetical protein
MLGTSRQGHLREKLAELADQFEDLADRLMMRPTAA